MVINKNLNKIKENIENNKCFVSYACYYDDFSKIWINKINHTNLNLDIIELSTEEFNNFFNYQGIIYPAFIFFDGNKINKIDVGFSRMIKFLYNFRK